MKRLCRRDVSLLVTWTLLLVLSLVFYLSDGLPLRNTENSQSAQELLDSREWAWSENENCLQGFEFAPAKDFRYWFCYQNRAGQPDVGLVGSSRLNQMVAGFSTNRELSAQNIVSIGACGMLMDRDLRLEFRGRHPCDVESRNVQFDFFEQVFSKDPLQVMLVEGGTPHLEGPEFSEAEKMDAALERLVEIQDYASTIVVVAPWRVPPFAPADCLGRPILGQVNDCRVSTEEWSEQDANWAEFVALLNQFHPDVKIFDPNLAYCDEVTCDFLYNGQLIMRDRTHISELGSTLVAEHFADWAALNLEQFEK